MVTLPNDDGCFTMDGIIPMDAIVDTGAKKVMIGREVVEMMGLTMMIWRQGRLTLWHHAHWRHHGGSPRIQWC